MSYRDSYIWGLRQIVGSRELLVPGAQVLLVDGARAVFQRRTDSGEWEIPAGSAEPGQSFTDTAIAEVREEIGLEIVEADLIPFASFSDPVAHRLHYPNGDIVHAFALCFATYSWSGDLSPDEQEVTEVGLFPLASPPSPLRSSTRAVLDLYSRFIASGSFQAC